ncbi:unnamed protein product, partial [Polarella glacialis]
PPRRNAVPQSVGQVKLRSGLAVGDVPLRLRSPGLPLELQRDGFWTSARHISMVSTKSTTATSYSWSGYGTPMESVRRRAPRQADRESCTPRAMQCKTPRLLQDELGLRPTTVPVPERACLAGGPTNLAQTAEDWGGGWALTAAPEGGHAFQLSELAEEQVAMLPGS